MPIRNGLYSGATYYVHDADQAGGVAIDALVRDYMDDPSGADAIISITMAPTAFSANQNDAVSVEKSVAKPTAHGSHTVRNNKLLTFPYCYLVLDCLNDSKEYRYEWFSGSSCAFNCVGVVAGNPNVSIAPKNYQSASNPMYTEQLVMGGYPQCAINIDSYRQWLANNGIFNVISQAASVGAIMAAPTAMGIGAGMVGLASAVSRENIERHRENTARGPVASDANIANRTKDLYFLKMALPAEKAKSIDDFFDRYGYACERVKEPNIHARPKWSFVKTKDCIVKGNVPATAIANIASYFNKGITFWDYTATVGDYSQNNAVLPHT